MPITSVRPARGHSSVGRAPALQAGGRRFDPVWLHQPGLLLVRTNIFVSVLDFDPSGGVLSDIVKRGSIRALIMGARLAVEF
jgi:hypothetical protein